MVSAITFDCVEESLHIGGRLQAYLSKSSRIWHNYFRFVAKVYDVNESESKLAANILHVLLIQEVRLDGRNVTSIHQMGGRS